jgi:hypothetical protein
MAPATPQNDILDKDDLINAPSSNFVLSTPFIFDNFN